MGTSSPDHRNILHFGVDKPKHLGYSMGMNNEHTNAAKTIGTVASLKCLWRAIAIELKLASEKPMKIGYVPTLWNWSK